MSIPEELFLFHVQSAGLPEPVREFRFVPGRRFRADFAWIEQRLLVEIEGGVFMLGRHSRGAGFTKDCEKYNLAALDGWKVLRFTSGMVSDGSALETVVKFFETAPRP